MPTITYRIYTRAITNNLMLRYQHIIFFILCQTIKPIFRLRRLNIMRNKYPHIFEPLTVRRMTVKNRIVMTPMGTNYGEQNGEMSFLHINYYEQRAKGGTGMLIVENASVDSPQGSNGTTQLRIDLDNYIPRLFKLCESVHKHGACIAVQLNHAGASAMSSRIGMFLHQIFLQRQAEIYHAHSPRTRSCTS